MINNWLNKWLIYLLESAIKDLKSGDCELSPEEASTIFDALADIKLNKHQAAEFLGISQSMLDVEVADGHLPEGKKLYAGDTHKYWVKRDLIHYLNKRKK